MCVCVCVCVCMCVCVCVCVCVCMYVSGKGTSYISMELEEHKAFFLPHFVVRLSF